MATYEEIIHSQDFKNWFGDWEYAYEKAGLNFNHPAWRGVSKCVDENGMPMVLYHGTTHEWTVYSRKLGNHENDMGVGFYATSSEDDAKENYLSEGADLTGKIARYAEHYGEKRGIDYEKAKEVIAKKLKGGTERIIDVFLKIKKPLIISVSGRGGTYFDFQDEIDENEEYQMSKDYIRFKEAFDDVAEDFDLSFSVKDRVWSEMMSNFEPDSVSAYQIIHALKRSYELLDYTYDEKHGGSKQFEFISQIFQKYGFDGVIYLDASEHFKGLNISKGTRHYIAFKPKQIKLADGTNTTFDGSNPDIRFMAGGNVEDLEDLISKGIVELKMFDTKPEHAKEYGFDVKKPLYVQSICITENQRLKGLGKKVLDYIDEYAVKNGHDLIFGHITQKANFTRDSRHSDLCDIDLIKEFLIKNGYNTIKGNNDFYKYTNHDIRLLAPNGKPSNLTPEQYKLVRTPEFKAWFGDWEKLAISKLKDPAMDEVTLANLSKDVSKVVDENGEPKTMWHYSPNEFTIFNPSAESRWVNHRKENVVWFGGNEKVISYSEGEKGFLYKCFLNVKNPIIVDAKKYDEYDYYKDEQGNKNYSITRIKGRFVSQLGSISWDGKRNENDGVIFYNAWDNISLGVVVAVPNPTQIKLADGTNTTFDGGNPDIRYADGGKVNTELYDKWKSLVNMSASELQAFMKTKDGKEAGLTKSEADELGIKSGHESAKWILKMKKTNVSKWTDKMWEWAKRQVSFISRMRGNRGGLYDQDGNKTRKHTSLLIWGHNPTKFNGGGKIDENTSLHELAMDIEKDHKYTFDRIRLAEKYLASGNNKLAQKILLGDNIPKLLNHFEEEQKYLFPRIKNDSNSALINRILNQHKEFRKLFKQSEYQPDNSILIAQLIVLLKIHMTLEYELIKYLI